MASTEKLVLKLANKSIKKAELETLLARLGLQRFRGKGSHEVWGKKGIADLHIVIATHSKEVPSYQLRQIEASLRKRGLI